METIFLTGATGHVGFRTLVLALQAGFPVRAAVRSLGKAEAIKRAPSIIALNPGPRLSFVEVPNMAMEDAFDNSLDGVSYVVHVASPIASKTGVGGDLEAHYIGPSVQGTLNLLKAAKLQSSIKRVVITSSLAATVDLPSLNSGTHEIMNEATRTANIPSAPYKTVFEAYCASKALTLKAAEEFILEQTPTFGVTHILPGDIYGPNELDVDPEAMVASGSNRIILIPITGGNYGPAVSATIHVDDVAKAHIVALDPNKPTNRLYLLHSGGIDGYRIETIFEIVREHFKEHVGKILPNNGTISTLRVPIDSSDSENTLGFKFAGFATQVTDLVAYYVKCVEKKQRETDGTI